MMITFNAADIVALLSGYAEEECVMFDVAERFFVSG